MVVFALGSRHPEEPSFVLRQLRPGDVIVRHDLLDVVVDIFAYNDTLPAKFALPLVGTGRIFGAEWGWRSLARLRHLVRLLWLGRHEWGC